MPDNTRSAIDVRAANASVTVHGLRGGFALCGFADTVPMNWPDGHIWVDPRFYPNDIDCPGCRAIVDEEAVVHAKDN